jgi:formylglycine-generating enzyme required for sulfatase activity
MTSFGFGESRARLGSYGWYQQNSQERSWPVGMLLPNALGLFDMHGSVFEWCQDCYMGFPSTWHGKLREDDGLLATGAKGSSRVVRGGSWSAPARVCRSAVRGWYRPSSRLYYLGFRVAFSSVEQSGR